MTRDQWISEAIDRGTLECSVGMAKAIWDAGAAAERERWILVGVCDPTVRHPREPDPRGYVHYLLTGRRATLDAALERLRGHAVGLVGGYVPLPSDQFAAIALASGTAIGYAIEMTSDGQSIRYEAPTAAEAIRLAAMHESRDTIEGA